MFFVHREKGATDSMSEREYDCWADTSLNPPGASYVFTLTYVIKHYPFCSEIIVKH